MEDYEIRGKVDQFVKWFGRIDKWSKWAGHLYLIGGIIVANVHVSSRERFDAIIIGLIFWGLYQVTRILSFGVAWSVVEMTMNSRAKHLGG